MARKEDESDAVLVWDSDESIVFTSSYHVLMWSSYEESLSNNTTSILRYVDDNAECIRSRYLSYIQDLGEKKYKKKRIIDHLQLRENFSYWWLSIIEWKSVWTKSAQLKLTTVIKVLALEKWLGEREIAQIKLVSADPLLLEVIQSWCSENDISFICEEQIRTKRIFSTLRRVYACLPLPVRAIIWLTHYLITRWRLSGAGVSEWRKSKTAITFVSYFFNLEKNSAEKGVFESLYWPELPDTLEQGGCSTRWLHIWIKDSIAPTAIDARQLIEQFNRVSGGKQIHVTLDSFLGFRPVMNTLLDWLRLLWKSQNLSKILNRSSSTAMDLWPILSDDWQSSLKGPIAIRNLLMLNLFEEAFSEIPQQKRGFYLQENQGWEFGCITAWKNSGHEVINGVPHSTVFFWDLRYFFDVRSYRQSDSCDLSLPSSVAVNGSVAKDSYLHAGYLPEHIVEVEALRYLHLDSHGDRCGISNNKETRQQLLVLGDYLPENTSQQMKLLEELAADLIGWKIVIKPHPACSVNLINYPGLTSLKARVTDQPISELLSDFNVVYSSITTSAAVDAYCAGLSVITALDPTSLNLSPLRGVDGVQFVSNSKKLISALNKTDHKTERKQYFFLDSDLPMWKRLLGMTE
jgi:surface carbohydrate biosynthesis protein (TIGR04326 family)